MPRIVSIGRGNAPEVVPAPPHRVEQRLDQLGGAVAPEQLGVQHGHRDQHAAHDDDHDAPAAQAVQAGAEPVDHQERADQREPERDVLEPGHRDRGLEADGRERPDRGEQHRDHALADSVRSSAAPAPSPSPRTPRSPRRSSPRRRCAGSPRRGASTATADGERQPAEDERPPAGACRQRPGVGGRDGHRAGAAEPLRDRPAPAPRPERPARPADDQPPQHDRDPGGRGAPPGGWRECTAEKVTDGGWPEKGWYAGPRRARCAPASR